MLKAIYDFKSIHPKTLSFQETDIFLLLSSNTKEKNNWWLVVNEQGHIGYVPTNYITHASMSSQQTVKFIDGCIRSVHVNHTGQTLPKENLELVQKLMEIRRNAGADSPLKTSPCLTRTPGNGSNLSGRAPEESGPFLPRSNSLGTSPCAGDSFDDSDKREQPCANQRTSAIIPAPLEFDLPENFERRSSSTRSSINSSPACSSHQLTARNSAPSVFSAASSRSNSMSLPADHSFLRNTVSTPGVVNHGNHNHKENKSTKSLHEITPNTKWRQVSHEMVELVRKNSQLSHQMSQLVVQIILRHLQTHVPSSVVANTLSPLLEQLRQPIQMSRNSIEDTHDAKRLKVIFQELTECKDDEQQRSWILHEDEPIIIEYVQELISILTNADPEVCRVVMATDGFQWVLSLVQYYQMETRWSIRMLLLQAFGAMCGVHANTISLFLNSILPMEIARDMMSHTEDINRLCYSGLCLTMILSMGELMPINHFDHLGEEFVDFILESIGNPPDADTAEQIPDLFMALILSYNLQFTSNDDNITIRTLVHRGQAKVFTEKAMVLINREEDPARIFAHKPSPPNSVVKLFLDMFYCSQTATLFYTTDVKVLIDIIIRQLSDLSPGEKKRHSFLCLCQLVVRNSTFSEHRHRKEDLLKCFTSILCEEGVLSREDQHIVKDIFNEFPLYFKVVTYHQSSGIV